MNQSDAAPLPNFLGLCRAGLQSGLPCSDLPCFLVGQPFLAVRLFPNPSQGHDIGDSGQQPEHRALSRSLVASPRAVHAKILYTNHN